MHRPPTSTRRGRRWLRRLAVVAVAVAVACGVLTQVGTRVSTAVGAEGVTTVGGDPWPFRWYPGGFDDQVPSRSPFLTGAANNTRAHLHGKLLPSDTVIDLVVRTLAAR